MCQWPNRTCLTLSLPAAAATSLCVFSFLFDLILVPFPFVVVFDLFLLSAWPCLLVSCECTGVGHWRGLLALYLCSSEVGHWGGGRLAGAAQLGRIQRDLHPPRHPRLRAPAPGEERPEGIHTTPFCASRCPSDQPKRSFSVHLALWLSLSVLLPVTLFAILCCTALLGFHCASVVRVSEYLRDLPPDARRVIISRLGSEDVVVWWAAAHRHASVCVAHDYSQHVYVFVIRGALWANQALFTPAMNVRLIRSDREGKISNFLSTSLPFKCLGSVRFLEEVFYAHQGCIYLIKNTVITVIL